MISSVYPEQFEFRLALLDRFKTRQNPEPTKYRYIVFTDKRGVKYGSFCKKQDASKNLLDALLHRAENVLYFLDDLSVPLTNNQTERDLRMIKVQQKVSGTFRSTQGATSFCIIRSYLATMRKQGRSMLGAMAAVFAGTPFSIAWGT
jgi:hypothetical protein